MSSQIGYIICLANTTNKTNILRLSLIKYKQVTRSVLVAKLYKMAYKFDIGVVIKVTLGKIFGFAISLIICTGSKSLYDYLFKIDTI